jgi:hypothetical protein
MDHEYVSEESKPSLASVSNSSLALMEIRILIATMVLNYTWSGLPDVPGKWDEEMRPYESMVIRPLNRKCVLELKRK